MKIQFKKLTTAVLATGLIGAACGGADASNVMSEISPLSAEEQAFSECDKLDEELHEHTRLLVNVVDDIALWVEVDDVKLGEDSEFSEVAIFGSDTIRDRGPRDYSVGLYSDFRKALTIEDPAIVRSHVALHLSPDGLGLPDDGIVVAVMHEMRDGTSRLAGSCETVRLNRALSEQHGQGLKGFSQTAKGLVGAELAEFALPSKPANSDESPVLLNPDSHPVEELAKLRTVLLFYSIDAEVPEMAICSKTGAGWNDCFGLSGVVADSGGVVMQGFVDESGVLEIVATDERANLLGKTEVLSRVQLSDEQLRYSNLSIRVELQSHALRSGRLRDGAKIGLIADLTDEESETSYWDVEAKLREDDLRSSTKDAED